MARIKTVLLTLLSLVFVGIGLASESITQPAFALEMPQSKFERQNVLDDLNGATVNGEKFELMNYPYNASGTPQILSFIEFCYGATPEKQVDYGLYIYVYNPSKIAFNLKSTNNRLQMRTGGNSSASFSNGYKLKFLNSDDNGLFLKFKVDLTSIQKSGILNRVQSSERVYEVSGFELMIEKNIEEYSVGITYKYSGYVKGYAPLSSQDGTLNCISDGGMLTLSPQVRSTAYRPEGTNGSPFKQDTLHSVYFSIPNKILEKYGEMTKVHAKWLNAYTAPIFVTGNKGYYDKFFEQIGKEAGGKYAFHTNSDGIYIGGHYFANYSHGYNFSGNKVANEISKLHYVFYAENGNADNYTVPAEELVGDKSKGVKGWFETYTENYSSDNVTLVDERFDSVLFEKVDDKYTEKTISESDEDFKLTGIKYSSKSLWQKIYGLSAEIEYTNEYSISPMQKVTLEDISSIDDKTAFCNQFYIHETDYDKFCEYVNDADKRNETVYLFRYMQSEYFSAEQAEGEYKEGFISNGIGIPYWGTYFATEDTNAFICQTWVQLGFNIIDITFKLNDVETVIPVVMSPIDIAPPLDHPVITTPDFEFWRYGVGIMAGLLGVLIIAIIINKGVDKE